MNYDVRFPFAVPSHNWHGQEGVLFPIIITLKWCPKIPVLFLLANMRAKDCFLSIELKIRYITYLFGYICMGDDEMTDK